MDIATYIVLRAYYSVCCEPISDSVTTLLVATSSVEPPRYRTCDHTDRYGTAEGAELYALCHSHGLTCDDGDYCNNSADLPESRHDTQRGDRLAYFRHIHYG